MNTNHIQEEVINKRLSPRVKLKLVWLCSTVTSDRHGEGQIPNTPTGAGNKETRLTSQVPKQKHTIDSKATSKF